MKFLEKIKQMVRDEVKATSVAATAATAPAAPAPSSEKTEETEGAITAEIRDAISAAVGEAVGPMAKEVSQAKADLVARDEKVKDLEKQLSDRDGKITALEAENKDLKGKIADPKGAIQTTAAAKAAEIAQAMGAAPVTLKPEAGNPAKPDTLKSELKGLAKVKAAFAEQLKAK